ncbi:MAG: beta-eliminating lyase-related protein [Acidimicrobiia bacterium]|nr:beta-eliminating lyase-related protein [Acidimicrobiia bacterium]
MIDLRSDTVTQPTPEMRQAIAAAPVGDDVYHDDPSVLALEELVSDLLGKEDAIYLPTGTMSNQVAIRAHTQPGDVVLAAAGAHVNTNELGAANALAGVTIKELTSTRGAFSSQAVVEAVPHPPAGMPGSLFQPVTLVATENTHNGAGGAVWPLEQLNAVAATAGEIGLGSHLDGARLWNASAATGVAESEYARGFDTVSVCFSKGLGAPLGSALVGNRGVIDRARRFKQMYGGGFRQAGMMAAGATYAVTNHRQRLSQDHGNAKRVAAGIAEVEGLDVDLGAVETNMVYFQVKTKTAAEFATSCRSNGVDLLPTGSDTIRIVFHLGVTEEDATQALAVITAAAV